MRGWTGEAKAAPGLRRSALLLLALLLPAEGGAQRWEELAASRKAAGEATMEVHVRYGAGHLRLERGEPGSLYAVRLRYDSDRFEPMVEYERGRLEVGVETRGRNIDLRKGDADGGELTLGLSPEVATDLRLELGAVRSRMDLGGLRLSRLEVATGASETEMDFSRPNTGPLERAEFRVGAADFRARNLANLGARQLSVEAGVGRVALDFGGRWSRDLEVDVSLGLGSLELRVPPGVGVRLRKESFLTELDAEGFTRDGSDYVSANWDTAGRRLVIDVEAAFGSIRVVRTRQEASS
ncbi:MAG: hypothetical protein RQ751_01800 [Longimicrobiales bacterium]|nr:hypothetical protein [Longimicrobiales bacterium]